MSCQGFERDTLGRGRELTESEIAIDARDRTRARSRGFEGRRAGVGLVSSRYSRMARDCCGARL